MSSIDDALAVLEAMKGPDWGRQFEIYLAALESLPEHLIEPAVSRLAGETWRPSPFDIVRQAAKTEMCLRAGTFHPFPSADEAYCEIQAKISSVGMYRTPQWSHPLVAKTVAMIGGWQNICTGEANFSEGLSKQVKSIYERQSDLWVEEAVGALRLAPEQNARCFPRWNPHPIAIAWEEPAERKPRELTASPALVLPPGSIPLVPPPDRVRDMFRKLKIEIGTQRSDPREIDRGIAERGSSELKRIAAPQSTPTPDEEAKRAALRRQAEELLSRNGNHAKTI